MSWKDKFPKENIYFETNNGILYCGDCLEIMKKFSNECINFVLTDPPYGISRETNFYTMDKGTVMNFGKWDNAGIIFDAIYDIVRLAKKGASFVIFVSSENIGKMVEVMNKNRIDFKRQIVLLKRNPAPFNRDRLFLSAVENALWFVKGKGWTFNRINKYELNYIFVSTQAKKYHTTPKDISAIKYLVQVLSNKGDIVFDPFLGSGTTAIACERLNRRWIGIEINPKYCEITKQRIVKLLKQPKRKILL